jgi:hypothetical protein
VVGGSAVGSINYSIWWNCAYNTGNSDLTPTFAEASAFCGLPVLVNNCGVIQTLGYKCDGDIRDLHAVSYTYASAGNKRPIVIVERSGFSSMGSANVTVNPPAVPSVSLFLNATLEPPGLDTGIDVVVGQRLNISASGLAQYGYEGELNCTGYPTTDANGERYVNGKNCGPKHDCSPFVVMPCQPIGLLIARIGDGPWFSVGSDYSSVANRGGRLRLLYNEAIWYDDSGAHSVTIRLD